jgi:hypothetical protein
VAQLSTLGGIARMTIPTVTSDQMTEVVRRQIPTAQFEITFRHPEYDTWRLMVTAEGLRLEYSWGPLSGFGVTDFLHRPEDDADIFAPHDIGLESLDAAERFLIDYITKYAA